MATTKKTKEKPAEKSSLQITMVDISSLIPFANNARTHSDEQIAQIAASIREFGFNNPILIDGQKGVIAGHGRLLAARKLEMTEVPCLELSHMTDYQKRAYILADNRLAEKAGWDLDMVSLELTDLLENDFDINLTGFDDDFILPDETEGLTDPDAVPDVPETPVTILGDVWILGNHRLMCGDSTSIDAVEKLMDGQKADMVFTDPPYNVDYSGRGQNNLGTIKNDNMSDNDFTQFCRDTFACYSAVMKPLACIYVCHPDSATAPKLAFETAFGESFKKSSTIIWVKQSAGMGWQDYRAQHEPILYGWKEGSGTHFYCGDRSKTTVWNVSRDAQTSYKHPTQKPVALSQEAIMNSSKGEDIVVDLFCGSGSTLIACVVAGRIGRMMELDPKYCDVIIQRWQDFTGQKAVHENGTPFDASEVA